MIRPKCPECGGEVLRRDETCPACGAGLVRREGKYSGIPEDLLPGSLRKKPRQEDQGSSLSLKPVMAILAFVLLVAAVPLFFTWGPFWAFVSLFLAAAFGALARK